MLKINGEAGRFIPGPDCRTALALKTFSKELSKLQKTVINCSLCPRLVGWREKVAAEKISRFKDCSYWGRPVPGFGDPAARLLIVGLAPAAHGGNRTGRIFTGDRSGDWLFRMLHEFGYSSQAESVSSDDGLHLRDCYITAAAHCAPPQNRLLLRELENCRPFLLEEVRLLLNIRAVIALGRVAHEAAARSFRELGLTQLGRQPEFSHGASCRLNGRQLLIGSYHPSQQNTFTGRLTWPMFRSVFQKAKKHIESKQFYGG